MVEILIIRTNMSGPRLARVLAPYRKMNGVDLVVAADETRGEVTVPQGVQKVVLNRSVLENLGLPPTQKAGWSCGDYAFYAVRQALPQYDRYWMTEPDVLINFADPSDFFRRFADAPEDLLATFVGPRNEQWPHFTNMSRVHEKVFGCLFPLVRLSGRALDHLLQRRRDLFALWKERTAAGQKFGWPNDESFVTTEVMAAGMSAADLNDIAPDTYKKNAGWGWFVPVYRHAQELQTPNDTIYHPIVDDAEEFLRVFRRGVARPGPKNKPMQERLATALSTIPLSQPGPDRVNLDPEADLYLRSILTLRTEPDLLELAETELKQLGPAGQDKPIRHALVKEPARPGFQLSQAADFKVSEAVECDVFPIGRATAYAADFAKRELSFACVPEGAPLLDEPFFYLAQRKHAETIARVSFDRLHEIYDVDQQSAPTPMVVMSIGRCGSTLLNRLLSADGTRTISEPDVFSQTAGLRGQHPAQKGRDSIQLAKDSAWALRATVRSLEHWTGVSSNRMALKLRSQSNFAVQRLILALPKSRYVFVFRELESWLKSFVTSFGHEPQTLVRSLKAGIEACDILVRDGLEPGVVWYEEMSRDPEAVLRRLWGVKGDLPENVSSEIKARIGEDSQAGTKISRQARENAGAEMERKVADSIQEFHSLWAEHRPADAIARLDLPY